MSTYELPAWPICATCRWWYLMSAEEVPVDDDILSRLTALTNDTYGECRRYAPREAYGGRAGDWNWGPEDISASVHMAMFPHTASMDYCGEHDHGVCNYPSSDEIDAIRGAIQ